MENAPQPLLGKVLPDLGHFTGTTQYHRHRILPIGPGLLLTDGVHYVAEKAGAYWLMDMVLLGHRTWLLEGDGFVSLTLTVNVDGTASLTVSDGDYNEIDVLSIESTDFPTGELKFFMTPGPTGEPVIMLRSEY